MFSTFQPVKLCDSDSPFWKVKRFEGIGASEAAAACGLSEWETPLDVYFRKRGRYEKDDTLPMRIGRCLESGIADEFELETSLKVRRQPGLFAHPDHPYVLATPDGVIDHRQLAEFKSTSWPRAQDLGEPWTDRIYPEWIVQAQQQMAVMGAEIVHLGVLIDGKEFRCYHVGRNEHLIDLLLERVTDLWTRIQEGRPPEPDLNHPSTANLLKQLYPSVREGEVKTLSANAVAYWERYEATKKTIRELERDAEIFKNVVLCEIEEAEGAGLPDGRILRRKVVERQGYTVEPSSYVELRAVSEKTFAKGLH